MSTLQSCSGSHGPVPSWEDRKRKKKSDADQEGINVKKQWKISSCVCECAFLLLINC